MKAHIAAEARTLRELPNVGLATAADLELLGLRTPAQLKGRDPLRMYRELCRRTGMRHDPCMLDVFIAVVRFMDGGPPLPWHRFTAERKRLHPNL